MGIRITNCTDEYDHIFMSEQSILQRQPKLTTDGPIYIISLAWKRYKINVDNTITFAPEAAHTMYISDFYSQAVTEYMSGDSDLITGLTGNEIAVASLLNSGTAPDYEVTT